MLQKTKCILIMCFNFFNIHISKNKAVQTAIWTCTKRMLSSPINIVDNKTSVCFYFFIPIAQYRCQVQVSGLYKLHFLHVYCLSHVTFILFKNFIKVDVFFSFACSNYYLFFFFLRVYCFVFCSTKAMVHCVFFFSSCWTSI